MMNEDPDHSSEESLLRAVLGDEAWQVKNASGRVEALNAFGAHQRTKRVKRWMGYLMGLTVVIGLALHWFENGREVSRPGVGKVTQAPEFVDGRRQLTDQELLASFPQGSCFLAEVDGKKELVFLDPDVERLYVSDGRQGPR
jgi:hypothetical protein